MRPKNYAQNKVVAIGNETPASTQADATKPAGSNGSTGPRSDAGKKRSSINATRHGLSGRIVVLPTEDMSLYMKQSKEIVDSFDPQTPVENKLAQTVADGYWRMERFRTVEEGLLAWGTYEEAGDFDAENANIHSAFTAAAAFRANSQAFVNLSIYEQRIQRGIEKAMKQLQELQALRKSQRDASMHQAMKLYEFDKMMLESAEQIAVNPPENEVHLVKPLETTTAKQYQVRQFVYSSEEIARECQLRDRNYYASVASNVGFDHKEYLKMAA
jgi:hypothetical protein